MRAAIHHEYGGADAVRLEETDIPRVGPDQLLIRVQAASLNRSDWEALSARPAYVRLSGSGFRRPKNRRLGTDVAGIVEEIGSAVTRFAVGDEVFGDMLWAGPGAFADFMRVPERSPLAKKPPALSFSEAAALPQAAGLAWQALTERAPASDGKTVLVNGGGGGAGTFAIQLAKRAGATVVGIDTAEKADVMRAAGADDTIDFRTDRSLAVEHRYDRIVDFAGGRSVVAFARSLAPGGSYAMVGGSIPSLLQTVIGGGLISLATSRSVRLMMAKPNTDDLGQLADMVVADELQPMIDRTYPLDDIAEAFRYFAENRAKGKIVVTM